MNGDGSAEERVRPCLACGELVTFDGDACPACGAQCEPTESAEEAVRPCLSCGTVLPFDVDACPHCGAGRDLGDEEEAVKPCLECGNILPFDAEVCSLCGTRCRGGAAGEEAVKPCLACEALLHEEDFFCPECGDFALSVAVASASVGVPALGSQEGKAVTFLSRLVSVVVLLAAVSLVAVVLVEAWRVRGLGDF